MVVHMVQQDRLAELVERARRGNREAFDHLADLYRQRLQSLIQHQLGESLRHRAGPEDVLQETLLRAFESLDRFEWRGEEYLFRWLAAISRHVVLELAAKEKRERTTALGDDILGGDPTQSKALRREERFDRLQSAFDELAPDQQKVVLLARVERVPVKEIARRMGRSPNAVSRLLLRALQRLRERFGDTESFGLPDIRLQGPEIENDE